jgi:hypothetical protein
MNDLLIQALLAEYNEADPLYTRRPHYYESTNRQERTHLRTLPRKGVSLPKLNLSGIVSFRSRSTTTSVQPCCPAAAA